MMEIAEVQIAFFQRKHEILTVLRCILCGAPLGVLISSICWASVVASKVWTSVIGFALLMMNILTLLLATVSIVVMFLIIFRILPDTGIAFRGYW
jgi:hypothetical protein